MSGRQRRTATIELLERKCERYHQEVDMDLEQLLTILRGKGWLVGIHNDYKLKGKFFTFWLFTHSGTGKFFKGEGESDLAAVFQVLIR